MMFGCDGALIEVPSQLALQAIALAQNDVYVIDASMPNVMMGMVLDDADTRSSVTFGESDDKKKNELLKKLLIEKSNKYKHVELHESQATLEEEELNLLMLITTVQQTTEGMTEANAQLIELMTELAVELITIEEEQE